MNAKEIEETLKYHLDKNLFNHSSKDAYYYSVLPGGKLFRPSLVWSILKDINQELYLSSLNDKNSAHALLSSAIEIHHSYTLVHDDLPSMDNDQIRRGKPTTHIQFGEWQAILCGDGLLNLSYQLIFKVKNKRTLDALKYFSWSVGPKGLILGQFMDLSKEMTENIENTLKTHELKTARLIQASILCSAILASDKNYHLEKKLIRYSKLLGINFQLLDDLTELVEKNLTSHEKDVNPWLKDSELIMELTLKNLEQFKKLSDELSLIDTNKIVTNYYEKLLSTILSGEKNIKTHLKGIDLIPIVSALKTFR